MYFENILYFSFFFLSFFSFTENYITLQYKCCHGVMLRHTELKLVQMSIILSHLIDFPAPLLRVWGRKLQK